MLTNVRHSFWLVLNVRGLPLLLAGVVALEAGERPRTKVVFSDSKAPSSLPSAATQDPSLLRPQSILPQRGSLEGVAAAPFAPPAVAPRATRSLPDRDALDQKREWLRYSVENLSVDDQAAAKAFGVREYTPESAFLGTKTSKSAFRGLIDEKSDDDTPATPRFDEEKRWKDFSGAAVGERPLLSGVSSSASDSAPTGTDGDRTAVFFSDSEERGFLGGSGMGNRGGSQRGEDLVSAALNRVSVIDPLRASGRDGQNRDAVAPREEFRKLLGLGAAVSGAQGGRLIGGVGDAINLQPDLTRQEINPVVPRVAPGVKTAELPSFTAAPVASESQQNILSQPLLDVLSSRAYAQPNSDLSVGPLNETRKLNLSPTVLPVPKRSF